MWMCHHLYACSHRSETYAVTCWALVKNQSTLTSHIMERPKEDRESLWCCCCTAVAAQNTLTCPLLHARQFSTHLTDSNSSKLPNNLTILWSSYYYYDDSHFTAKRTEEQIGPELDSNRAGNWIQTVWLQIHHSSHAVWCLCWFWFFPIFFLLQVGVPRTLASKGTERNRKGTQPTHGPSHCQYILTQDTGETNLHQGPCYGSALRKSHHKI